MVDVRISLTAKDQLESLPNDVQERIKNKLLDEVAADPGRHLKQLRGSDDYRARIGDYRAIVEWDKQADEVRVHEIGHRRNVYD
jgi:mRNA interferase RelE/StbE